jgi:hypothetical protein
MKKKSIQAKLSFALDDDDDDNDNNDDYNNNKTSSSSTMLKSMQAIKKKRKIKQAPNVESINESILHIQTSSSSSSSYIFGCGGDYSKESLDRLKEAQKFRVINQESTSSSSGGVVIEDNTLMDHDDDIVTRNEDGVDSRIHHTTIDHDHHGIDGINSNDNNHMNSIIDGDEILFELSGEEAEAEFIAFTERTIKSISSNADATDSYDQISSSSSSAIQSMSYGAYIDQNNTSSSERLDHDAIYQAKLDNKKILNREYIKERLYISTTTATNNNNNNIATTATTSAINGGK